MTMTCSSFDNFCYCKHHNPLLGCPCEEEDLGHLGETEPGECPDCPFGTPEYPGVDSGDVHFEWIGEPLAEGEWTGSNTFDVGQFLDIAFGNTLVNTLDDLTTYHLNNLLYIISKKQAEPDYQIGRQFAVMFPNGGVTNGRAEDMVIVLESLRDSLLTNPWLADLDRDGVISVDDQSLLLDTMELAMNGEPVSTWFDLNGDGSIDADDLVLWQLMHESVSAEP